MAGNLTFISGDTVESVLRYADLIPAMETALARFSDKTEGRVVQPMRSFTEVAKYEGNLGVMPVYSEEDAVLGTKLVTVYPRNTEVPTHQALILLFDPSNGMPLALLDGDVITTMRTASASAAATKALYKKTPEVLAIVGAGVQGMSHYQAISSIFSFSEVRICSRTLASAEKMASKVSNARAFRTVEETVRGADIIVVATFSATPILIADWVKPGAHINGTGFQVYWFFLDAMGACRPDWHELDPELVRSAVVFADSRESAMQESGDIILSQAEVFAEVGEVIRGLKAPPPNRTTIFKSLGIALEDAVAAKMVYDKVQANK